MAEYVITPANLNPQGAVGRNIIAGVDIDAGMLFYQDANDQKAYKSLADTLLHSGLTGIAIASAKAGQSLAYLGSGNEVIVGAIFSGVGRVLVLTKTTAGAMMDPADMVAGKFLSIVGYSTPGDASSSGNPKLMLDFTTTGKAYT